MPTFRRHRPAGTGAGPGALRSSLADAAFAVEDRVALGAGGLLDAVKWPFQRIAWAIENYLVWPIDERTAGWSRGTRAWSVVALALLAGGGVAAGIAISNPSSGGTKVPTLPGPSETSSPAHHAAVNPSGPVLKGIAPNFNPGGSARNGKASGGEEVISSNPGGAHGGSEGVAAAGAKAANEPAPAGSESGAAANGPEVAGPAAIKVARHFADAFVLYEIGKTSARVKKAFAETASPDLAKALLGRPPRLPSNVKVPKARVLNVVVGPTSGSTYSLSVSLLRVGVTSELRLDMKRVQQSDKSWAWQVTDVTG